MKEKSGMVFKLGKIVTEHSLPRYNKTGNETGGKRAGHNHQKNDIAVEDMT